MARRTLPKAALALALIALALPPAALARKNAWQYASVSGTYAYHAVATAPLVCSGNINSGDGAVLTRDYSMSFHGDGFNNLQLAAKYFPVFGGPQTNGPGQKAHLAGQGTVSETFRTFTVGSDADGNQTCSQQDQTCTATVPVKTARFLISVTHKRFRYNGPIQIVWHLNFLFSIPDCTPKASSELARGLLPENTSVGFGDYTSPANKRQFARKRATFAISGHSAIPGAQGFGGQITYSAKTTLKKVVIADGCADTKPQHLFVCKL